MRIRRTLNNRIFLHRELPPPVRYLSISHLRSITEQKWPQVLTNSRPSLTVVNCKNYNLIKLLTACNIKI